MGGSRNNTNVEDGGNREPLNLMKFLRKIGIVHERHASTIEPEIQEVIMNVTIEASTNMTETSVNETETTQIATQINITTTIEAPTTWPDLASSTETPQPGIEDNLPVIIGGAVGGTAFLIVFLLIFCCFCKRKKRKKKIPPELPHPFTLKTSKDTTEPSIIFHPTISDTRESTTSAHVQIVGYKPSQGAALLPPRKTSAPVSTSTPTRHFDANDKERSKSVATSLVESRNVYINDEVVKASSSTTEALNGKQSRDSLYVRPSSWLIPNSIDQNELNAFTHSEEEVEEINISRSRLDSQKYLIPAELVLHMPNKSRISVDAEPLSSPSSGLHLKWRAHAPIVHSADESNRNSSVYVCMDSGSQPNSPIRQSRSGAGSDSDKCTSPRSLPSPCRKTSNQSNYINLREDSETSDSFQPSFPSKNEYELVPSLLLPSEYGNAKEIMESQLPSSDSQNDRNYSDTYKICRRLDSPKLSESLDISEKFTIEKDGMHSDTETFISNTVLCNDHSNQTTGRDSTVLSYVNVGQFQKNISESEVNLVQKEENHQELDRKIPKVKTDPNLRRTLKKEKPNNHPTPPPKAKKPTTLPKPKKLLKKVSSSNSLAETLAGLQSAARHSLIKNAKKRMGTNSCSSPDLPSKVQREPPVGRLKHEPNTRQPPSQAEGENISASRHSWGNKTVEKIDYQNLLPPSVTQTADMSDNISKIKYNSNGINKEPVETNLQAKEDPKTKPAIPMIKQNRKSNSFLRGKLDLSELKSKLKKPTNHNT